MKLNVLTYKIYRFVSTGMGNWFGFLFIGSKEKLLQSEEVKGEKDHGDRCGCVQGRWGKRNIMVILILLINYIREKGFSWSFLKSLFLYLLGSPLWENFVNFPRASLKRGESWGKVHVQRDLSFKQKCRGDGGGRRIICNLRAIEENL